MKTDQLKGIPARMGRDEGGPVKVHVTPKSGMEGLRWWRVVISVCGRASGRSAAREDTVGTVSKEEDPMDSWEGRCGRWMGCVGMPKLWFTGGVKSRFVVHCMDIWGAQVDVRCALADMLIERVRT